MKAERRSIDYLKDMVEAIDKIFSYTKEMDFEDFENNIMVVDAVIRNFEIIGEAAKRVDENIKEKYPEVPWKQMNIFRNIASHEYFGVDINTTWHIITDHLPGNKKDLLKILNCELS